MSEFLLPFALVATVLTVTALASGLVERSPLSFPLTFLGLGLMLGEGGVGIVEMGTSRWGRRMPPLRSSQPSPFLSCSFSTQ